MDHSCKHQGSFFGETTHQILDTGRKYHPYTTMDKNWIETPRRDSTDRQPFSKATEPDNSDICLTRTNSQKVGDSSKFSQEYQISSVNPPSQSVSLTTKPETSTDTETRLIIRKVKNVRDFSANFNVSEDIPRKEETFITELPRLHSINEGTQTPQYEDLTSASPSKIKLQEKQKPLQPQDKLLHQMSASPVNTVSTSTQTIKHNEDVVVRKHAETAQSNAALTSQDGISHMVFLQDSFGITAGPLLYSEKPRFDNHEIHSSMSHLGEIQLLRVASETNLSVSQLQILKELLLNTLLQGKSLKILINSPFESLPSIVESTSKKEIKDEKPRTATPLPSNDDVNAFYASLVQRMKKLEEENVALKRLLMKDTGTDVMTVRPLKIEEQEVKRVEEKPIQVNENKDENVSRRPSLPVNEGYLSPKDSSTLYEMLQEFMVENEALRQDNARLLRSKEGMESENKKVLSESLTLAQRLEAMEKQVLPLLKQMENEAKMKSQMKQVPVPPSFLQESALFPNEYFDPHKVGNPLAPPQPLHQPMPIAAFQQMAPYHFSQMVDTNSDPRLVLGHRRLPPVMQEGMQPKEITSPHHQAPSPTLTRSRVPSHIQTSSPHQAPPAPSLIPHPISTSPVIYGPSAKQRLPPSGIPHSSSSTKNSSYREKYFPMSEPVVQSGNGSGKYAMIDNRGNIVANYSKIPSGSNEWQGRPEGRLSDAGPKSLKNKVKRWNA